MTCRSLEAAIVELARGREIGRGTVAAIESHLDHCPACAARLARERQVSSGLRALAASTAAQVPSAMLERRLLEAFSAQTVPPARRWWIPAAVAAAAVVGLFGWWQSTRLAPLGKGREVRIESRAVDPVPTTAPAAAIASAAKGEDRAVPPPISARRPRRSPPGRAGGGDTGFVALPVAAGLPDFESGIILRMEMPSAALSAYGIEIVPDARTPVQADLLIGQDGQARAIRLVTRATTRPGAEQ
jgi:hypothetical protein